MPGVVIPIGFGLCAFQFQCDGLVDPIITTIGYSNGLDVDPDGHAADIQQIWTKNTAPVGPFQTTYLASTYRLIATSCTEMTDSGPVVGVYSTTLAGTASATCASAQVSVIVSKRTARGGRQGRGRMFWPAGLLNDTEVDHAGIIQTSRVTALQTAATNILGAMVSAGLVPVLLHSEGTTGAPNQITAMTVQGVVATQRRRLR